MFTAKIVRENGDERIVQTAQVTYNNNENSVSFFEENGEPNSIVNHITAGHVYIMNDKGNTVSKYYLSIVARQDHPVNFACEN